MEASVDKEVRPEDLYDLASWDGSPAEILGQMAKAGITFHKKVALYEMKDVDVRRILQAYGLDRLDIIGVLNAFKSAGVRLMMEDD